MRQGTSSPQEYSQCLTATMLKKSRNRTCRAGIIHNTLTVACTDTDNRDKDSHTAGTEETDKTCNAGPDDSTTSGADMQAGRQTYRQTDERPDRQTDRQTVNVCIWCVAADISDNTCLRLHNTCLGNSGKRVIFTGSARSACSSVYIASSCSPNLQLSMYHLEHHI